MAATPEQTIQTMINNLPEKTGKSLDAVAEAARQRQGSKSTARS